jgi:hypothetical protein
VILQLMDRRWNVPPGVFNQAWPSQEACAKVGQQIGQDLADASEKGLVDLRGRASFVDIRDVW